MKTKSLLLAIVFVMGLCVGVRAEDGKKDKPKAKAQTQTIKIAPNILEAAKPKMQLPYQTRGTRTDMAPKVEVKPTEKKDSCKYTPTRQELERHAENAENLRSEFGPLFILKQRQLNRQWDENAKEACKTSAAKPKPLSIEPVSDKKDSKKQSKSK